MNKRDFLKLLALLLSDGVNSNAFGGKASNDGVEGKQRVLVIGAGLAGLAAARELTHAGCQVVLLEARDRIGGRIWTSDKWPDFPLDLGATWIHGVIDNPVTDLANQLGAKRLVTSYDRSVIYNTNGRVFSETEEAQLDDIRKQLFDTLRNAQTSDIDISVRQATTLLERSFTGQPAALRFLNFCISGGIEHDYAGSANRMSAHWYDSIKEFDGDDVLFVEGFKVITEYLAQDVDVYLSQVVKEIQWQGAEVVVRTLSSEYVADHVVVTLPLGVLQHNDVYFIPELPEEKKNAISKLGMGVLNKCYLRFPKVFWPDDMDWLEYVSEKHGEWTEWVSFKRTTQWPILLGFNAAEYGREIEAWSDEQIVSSAMATLKTMFGSSLLNPVDYQITRWGTDPFSRGSYSYNALNSTPAMRNDLARSVSGQLFFAGEASSKDYFGTAHGAYLSGVQAARQVLSHHSRFI